MNNIDRFLAYICVMVISVIVGLPAYIVGESMVMINAFFTALLVTICYCTVNEEYYED